MTEMNLVTKRMIAAAAGGNPGCLAALTQMHTELGEEPVIDALAAKEVFGLTAAQFWLFTES